MLDRIYTGFCLKETQKPFDILRNFLVVLAQSFNNSRHFRVVDLWSVMGFLRAFTSGFNLLFDV